MKFSELTVLLPCHSLEDFPVYYEGAQADELLASWCALWHPVLVASAAAIPGWNRVDVPPETLSGRLITVPSFCLDRLPAGFSARAKAEGACFVAAHDLDQAVAEALADLDGGRSGIDDSLAFDFLALGFCRLQIELLTRQMRYSMHVDETHFQNETVAAAQAAVAGDREGASNHLSQCFDTLYEARKHFYPVDVHFLEVLLLAPTTIAYSLDIELERKTPFNVLATAALLERIAEERPATWKALLAAIDDGRACVLGDEFQERELPLLPLEVARESIGQGVRRYEALLGRTPRVYGRRRSGLWPALPQILVKHGYHGALHFTLDDGRFPLAPQCKTRWEGLDGSVIDIFARLPSDAAKSDSFLGLSRIMADSMDSDHVATVAFAHWPGQESPWFRLLRRITELNGVLGKFMPLDDYFSQTDIPGRISRFEPDEYRTPYLKQAVIRAQPNPISSMVAVHRNQACQTANSWMTTVAQLLEGTSRPEQTCTDHAAQLVENTAQLAAALPRAKERSLGGQLIVNPLSSTRKVGEVEVPAMGFAWLESDRQLATSSRAKPIAQDNVLRNEFFELAIGRSSGGIQSLYNFKQRGNQLSQQIGLRLQGDDYTTMRATSVETLTASSTLGEIVSRGDLLHGERRVAGFQQTTRARVGSRVIELDIELSDVEEPRADPWSSYYGVRFAWPDETAQLWRGVSMARAKTDAGRLEAPEYIDIETDAARLSILTGGLPYHHRAGRRMLDSLLVVRGETSRRFSLAIGVNLPQPAAAALDFITPPLVVGDVAAPSAANGWFFHLDAKNVVATHWQPLVEEPAAAPSDAIGPAKIRGFRARLLETAGRAGRVSLRAYRKIASARQVDFLGQTMLQLPVEGDRVLLDFAACEWIEVEAVWAT